MALNVGDTVGDYQIIGILGAGGMGKVYKVRNVISDRVEAMKVLLPDLAGAPDLADRFIREIKLLASLNHPNIAALHTAMRVENQLLMIMEYVEGRTLEDRQREGRVPVPQAVDCIAQALSALGYAHERGVVHRDIKPANMMLTPSGELKLMDFGIAKAVADRRLTMTGTTLGSLYYMSPEQVKGSASLDGRSDLYSVGVTLYEIVTGLRPFSGDSDYSIMVAHLETTAKAPIEIDPSLPPALNEIILTAIQKDPDRRFQTAHAFRNALASVVPIATAPVIPGVAVPPPIPSAVPPTMPSTAFAPPPMPAPTAAQFAPPPVMPPPVPAAPGPSHRGLYMALGALVLLAVLAIAALQGPKWYRTYAGSAPQAAQETPAQPSQPPQEQPSAQPPAEASATSAATPQAPEAMPAAVAKAPASANRRSGSSRPERQEQQQYQQPAAPAVDTAALDHERERMGMLGARASAITGSLETLEQQQRRSGYGLRGDISASWRRMNFLIGQASAALIRQDAAGAKRNLDLAETEAEKLDTFLGH